MTSTIYTDLVGPAVNAEWLNDVNNSVYAGTAPGGGAGASVVQYAPAGTGASITASASGADVTISIDGTSLAYVKKLKIADA